jgi:hypothetical protein
LEFEITNARQNLTNQERRFAVPGFDAESAGGKKVLARIEELEGTQSALLGLRRDLGIASRRFQRLGPEEQTELIEVFDDIVGGGVLTVTEIKDGKPSSTY